MNEPVYRPVAHQRYGFQINVSPDFRHLGSQENGEKIHRQNLQRYLKNAL